MKEFLLEIPFVFWFVFPLFIMLGLALWLTMTSPTRRIPSVARIVNSNPIRFYGPPREQPNSNPLWYEWDEIWTGSTFTADGYKARQAQIDQPLEVGDLQAPTARRK